MIQLKLRKVGHSVGVLIPREVLAAMHVGEGDTLYLTEAPGGYRLTPYDPEFKQQMTVAREIMKATATCCVSLPISDALGRAERGVGHP